MKNLKEALLMLLGSVTITLGSIAITWLIRSLIFEGNDTPESRFILTFPMMATIIGATLLFPFAVLNLLFQLVKPLFVKPPKKL